MIAEADIRSFVGNVAAKFRPERIVLFGSYAEGRATNDSDVDLLVVMQHRGRDIDQAVAIRRAIDRDFPLDLIVRRPSDVRASLRRKDAFLTTIIERGLVLYGRGRAGLG